MADHIIIPNQTRWEKIKGEVKGFSPQVKQGLIMASVALISSVGGCISIYSENSRLKTKIHELELEVLPFRNLSVQQFNKADAESLKKLAESMATLQKDYSEQLRKTESLQAEIEQLRKSNESTDQTVKRLQRTIPAEQMDEFLSKLSLLPKAHIFLECRSGSSEAQHFANELLDSFKKSGFETEGDFSQHELGSYGERIQVNSVRSQPACAGPMQKLLNGFGFNFVGSEEGGLPTNTLRIIVFERKP